MKIQRKFLLIRKLTGHDRSLSASITLTTKGINRFREALEKYLSKILLLSIPKIYREEAKTIFWEGDNRSLNEALQYFYGGVEYRIAKSFKFIRRIINNEKSPLFIPKLPERF